VTVATVAAGPLTGIRLAALPPLALYVHLPWCVRKCPYCDFNSHELREALPERAYADALIADLEAALPSVWGRPIHSIFFGGGTPSVFSAESIDGLLAAIRARLTVPPDTEITLEANPGTFEAEKFRDFRAAGINRLSIGIQSFNPAHLQRLGRIHDDREAHRAIEIAHAHFENFNLDLMYALPDQTLAEAERDVDEAIATGAPHLSFYHLTIEPNTLFHRFTPNVPNEDVAATIGEMVERKLAEAGYSHYETSAHARPGAECRHNTNYWRFGDYLGIGAGAHAKISFADRIVREQRYKHPRSYMERAAARDAVEERHEIRRRDLPFEFMMNALRLADGFPVTLFNERTGLQLTAMAKPLALAEEKGLIERDHERVRATALGQRFLNDLLALFLPEENQTQSRG
jgi:putative oxygen-independent coproporphyrinogen III oxidase